jgi:hypothetical protein
MDQTAAEKAKSRWEFWQEITRLHEAGETAQAQRLYRRLQPTVPVRPQAAWRAQTAIDAAKLYAAGAGCTAD